MSSFRFCAQDVSPELQVVNCHILISYLISYIHILYYYITQFSEDELNAITREYIFVVGCVCLWGPY